MGVMRVWVRFIGSFVGAAAAWCAAMPSAEARLSFAPSIPSGATDYVSKGDPKIKAQVFQPSPLQPEDAWFQTYFVAPTAHALQEEYRYRWAYQDSQMPYYATQYQNEHWEIGSTDRPGRGVSEADYRTVYGVQVFRRQLHSAILTYASRNQNDGARSVASSISFVDQLKHKPIQVSAETKSEFRFGWDAVSDYSTFEWAQPDWEVGLYHPRLSAALQGGGLGGSMAQFRTKARPGTLAPTTTVTYLYDGASVELAILKPLNRRCMARAAHSRSLMDPAAPRSFGVSVAFIFE